MVPSRAFITNFWYNPLRYIYVIYTTYSHNKRPWRVTKYRHTDEQNDALGIGDCQPAVLCTYADSRQVFLQISYKFSYRFLTDFVNSTQGFRGMHLGSREGLSGYDIVPLTRLRWSMIFTLQERARVGFRVFHIAKTESKPNPCDLCKTEEETDATRDLESAVHVICDDLLASAAGTWVIRVGCEGRRAVRNRAGRLLATGSRRPRAARFHVGTWGMIWLCAGKPTTTEKDLHLWLCLVGSSVPPIFGDLLLLFFVSSETSADNGKLDQEEQK